jgi:hypothetical protein
MIKQDKAYQDDCLSSDIASLDQSFQNAGFGAIGYPTQVDYKLIL